MTELEKTLYEDKPQSPERTAKCIKENFATKVIPLDIDNELPYA